MIQAFRGDSGVTTEISGAAEIDEGDCLTRISKVPGCCRSAKARDFIRLEGQRPSSGRRQGHIRLKKPYLFRLVASFTPAQGTAIKRLSL